MTAWNSTLPLPKEPLKRRKPINKVSKKRRSEQSLRDKWEQAVFERDGHRCQNPTCKRSTDDYNPLYYIIDPHHIWEKGSNKWLEYVLENGITLCRVCHGLVHDKLIDLPIDRDALKEKFRRGVGTPIE